MLHRDVVNQFLNQHGLADARATEQADFSALQVRLGKVHDLDAGLEHFESGGLILEQRRRAVNRVALLVLHGAEIIHRLAEYVEHASQDAAPHRHGNRFAEVERLHAAHQTFRGLHRDATHAAFAQVLRHFRDDIERLGIIEPFAGDLHRVVNQRKMAFFKLDVHDRPDDFDDVPGLLFFRCHLVLLAIS